MKDSACGLCGGLIMQPFTSYGYSGPVCHCGDAWSRCAELSKRYSDRVEACIAEMRAKATNLSQLAAATTPVLTPNTRDPLHDRSARRRVAVKEWAASALYVTAIVALVALVVAVYAVAGAYIGYLSTLA